MANNDNKTKLKKTIKEAQKTSSVVLDVIKTKKDLDLIEQKVNIKKKEIEIKKEEYLLEKIEEERMRIEQERVVLDKVAQLRYMLTDIIVDEEKTLPGSDLKWKPVFEQEEVELIKAKLFEMLKKL